MVLTRSQSQTRSSAISLFFLALLGGRCSTRRTAAVETSVFIGFILIFSCCRRLSGEKRSAAPKGPKKKVQEWTARREDVLFGSCQMIGIGEPEQEDWGGAVSRGKKQSSTRRRRHSIADRSNDNTVASSALGAGQKKRRTKRATANQIK